MSIKPEGAPKDISKTGFNDSYAGIPPWDIGRPQKEFVTLAEAGEIKGSVLDAGCGTGEHVLYFAVRGQEAWGIDFAPSAIGKANEKAFRCHSRESENLRQRTDPSNAVWRTVSPVFRVANALALGDLGKKFDNIIDCGLFHCFSDSDRTRYAKSLSQALVLRGKYFMLCFSEHEPAEWGGPRRVTQQEIRDTFKEADGWRVNFIREAVFETNFHPKGGKAWMVGLRYLDEEYL